MVLSETRGLELSWVIRGGIECLGRLGAGGTLGLANRWILALEPERFLNPTDHRPRGSPGGSGRLGLRRSSGLRFQMLGIETGSFLPDD